jgi:WD40-like Beta Propeller Repeat
MFETYRMFGRDREAELEREARVRRMAAEVRRSRHAIPGGSRTAQAVVLAVVVAIISAAVAAGLSAWPSLWSAAASVESVPGSSPELNTTFLDGCPIPSPDGRSLYLASNRPGGLGGLDIWVARRASRNGPFGAPVNLGAPVNSAADDFCPSPMARKWFLFVSTRPGGCGGADIYVTRPVGRSGWWQPLHLGCHVNSAGQEASPYLFTHEKSGRMLIYFSSDRPGGFGPDSGVPDADIYVSSLTTVGFAPARLVPGLNTDRNDARPNLGPDGLEIVFDSDRAGALGGQDVYSATRANVREPWSEPVNLGPAVNTSAMETRASLSWDGNSLFFGSNRAGGEGSSDVYFSTRPAP